jgi:hypothetical protein
MNEFDNHSSRVSDELKDMKSSLDVGIDISM